MGTNNLSTKSNGETINAADPNQYKEALSGDLVPRNSSGVPTNEAGALGTDTYEWETVYTRNIQLDGTIANRGTVTTKEYTSTGSWEAPDGVYMAFVIAAGSGGDGDTESSPINNVFGAGGGGVAAAWVDVIPGNTYTITIGSSADFASLVTANAGVDGSGTSMSAGGGFSFASNVIGIGARGGNGGPPHDVSSESVRAESGYAGSGGLSSGVYGGGGGGYASGANANSGSFKTGGGGGYSAASGTSGGAAGLLVKYYLPSGVVDPN